MNPFAVNETDAPHLADILKGLGHPMRLRIVSLLCGSSLCVTELCDQLDARQTAVSQHLAPLRMLGLVTVDRRGGQARYTLAEPKLKKLVNCLKSCTIGAKRSAR